VAAVTAILVSCPSVRLRAYTASLEIPNHRYFSLPVVCVRFREWCLWWRPREGVPAMCAERGSNALKVDARLYPLRYRRLLTDDDRLGHTSRVVRTFYSCPCCRRAAPVRYLLRNLVGLRIVLFEILGDGGPIPEGRNPAGWNKFANEFVISGLPSRLLATVGPVRNDSRTGVAAKQI
jgi:hypothetical protein